MWLVGLCGLSGCKIGVVISLLWFILYGCEVVWLLYVIWLCENLAAWSVFPFIAIINDYGKQF